MSITSHQIQLEQLERLRSEIPRSPMVTHTRDSRQIPSQKRWSQSYKFLKIAKYSNFKILQETWHTTHLLKLLYKMYKYEMDPTRTVGATERTRDVGRTDGQMDGRAEWNQYTPQQLRCAWGIIIKSNMYSTSRKISTPFVKKTQEQQQQKLLKKQSIYRWFQTPWRSCDVTVMLWLKSIIVMLWCVMSRHIKLVVKWTHSST